MCTVCVCVVSTKDGAENFVIVFCFVSCECVCVCIFICYTGMHHLECFQHTKHTHHTLISIGFCWRYCYSDFMVYRFRFTKQPQKYRDTCMNIEQCTNHIHPNSSHTHTSQYFASLFYIRFDIIHSTILFYVSTCVCIKQFVCVFTHFYLSPYTMSLFIFYSQNLYY